MLRIKGPADQDPIVLLYSASRNKPMRWGNGGGVCQKPSSFHPFQVFTQNLTIHSQSNTMTFIQCHYLYDIDHADLKYFGPGNSLNEVCALGFIQSRTSLTLISKPLSLFFAYMM